MQTAEGHHVEGKLPPVRVQLVRESQARGDTRQGGVHKMVQIAVCVGGQF